MTALDMCRMALEMARSEPGRLRRDPVVLVTDRLWLDACAAHERGGDSPRDLAHSHAARLTRILVEVALGVGRWRFGLAVSGTAPAKLEDDLAAIELARLTGGLLVRAEVARVSRLSLELGGQLGIAAFRRATVQSAQGTVRTETRTTYTPALAPEVVVRFGPFARGWLALVLGVAADVVPGRPTIAYDLAGTVSPAHRLWMVQPRTQLSLEFLLTKI